MSTPLLSPILLEPIPVPRPWGGTRASALLDLQAPPSTDAIGEWWLLSSRAEKPSVISHGAFRGVSLPRFLEHYADLLLGPSFLERWRREFPLLIKVLDAAELLSLQVHPRVSTKSASAKTESWLILEARENAEILLGLRDGVHPADLFENLKSPAQVRKLVATRSVRRGDVAHVPAGCIHAFGANLVALEVQTNSDSTYRIYDWERKPSRELQLELARQVASVDQRAVLPSPRLVQEQPFRREILNSCRSYSMERLTLKTACTLGTDGERFEALIPLSAELRLQGFGDEVVLPRGHVVLIPAPVLEFTVVPCGVCEIVRILPEPDFLA